MNRCVLTAVIVVGCVLNGHPSSNKYCSKASAAHLTATAVTSTANGSVAVLVDLRVHNDGNQAIGFVEDEFPFRIEVEQEVTPGCWRSIGGNGTSEQLLLRTTSERREKIKIIEPREYYKRVIDLTGFVKAALSNAPPPGNIRLVYAGVVCDGSTRTNQKDKVRFRMRAIHEELPISPRQYPSIDCILVSNKAEIVVRRVP